MRRLHGNRARRQHRVRRALAALVTAGVLVSVVFTSVLVVASPAEADSIRDRQYWLNQYGISQAWNTTRGAGVTVAVIDTGIDGSHPDLAGQVIAGTDVSGVGAANGQTPVGDSSGHGTMVASLLAGRGHGNGDGVIGVAPDAKLLAVSMGFGAGTVSSDDQIATAVRWAVDNGADVINMSLTRNTLEWPESWDDAFLYAMQHDVVIVAAAGNRGSGTTQVGAPATMPGVLTVAGVDRSGSASFDASSQGITISVAAPSEELVGALPGGGYAQWDGTSGATPLVAGLVALVRSAHPELDAGNVINRITATASRVGNEEVSAIYGHGRINAAAAVLSDVPSVASDPADELTEWIRLYRRAESQPTEPPSATPKPTPQPVPAPAPGPENPLGTVLPTVDSLRNVGVPLLVYTGFTGLLAGTAVAAVRSFRRLRDRR
ncbi:MAG: S8 family serine peptidase [Homoserinimonas sp.]